ncbi:DMT family transporter [Agarivorans albus]|uniref:Metabolite transporter (DMT) superfamily n=1 Tax=Agarivorans albus MKT 106 TaxID=1331007 RepID=R9PH93_AGAAL|nr:DMT family transporter [Agarivorans albus]GAD00702.1 metabolite transporter (DMT) superfamily [Agarivorans albus MKT 106]
MLENILFGQGFHIPSNKHKGIALALVSTALFVVVGALVRVLSERIHVFEILLFRQLVFLVILSPAIFTHWQSLIRPQYLAWHSARIVGAFVALSLSFLVVANIPLADATALGFTQVIFVALISRLLLGEQVNWQRVVVIAVGFVGVLLVIQPSFASSSLNYIVLGLLSALGAAIAVICVKKLTGKDSTTNILAYQAVFVGVLAAIGAWFNWLTPSLYELMLLLAVGILSSIAQWFGVTAYKYGEANVVSNIEYVKMIYAICLGYFCFGEVPNQLAVLGAGILMLSPLLPRQLSRFIRKPS